MIKILKVRQKNLKRIIEVVKKAIKQGKVLVCPTDTVYGLIADATNKEAVKKLFKIKKRKREKAVPIFVKDIKAVKQLVEVDKEKEMIFKKVWPGEITIILKKKKGIKLFGVAKKTIALRIPNYKLLNILLSRINKPLTGTSANISGKKATTKIKEVISPFKNKKNLPDLILDAGNLKKSLPSTIIDLTGIKPKILRVGEKAPQFK
jgi:L-threonylcarbamoyladenylate synthase